MRFILFSKGESVGWAEMTGFDPSMGCASGPFHPNENYPKIRPTVREFLQHNGSLGPLDHQKLNKAWEKIVAQNWFVKDEKGVTVQLQNIHLVDFSEELEEDCYELQLCGLHWKTFDAYFPGRRETEKEFMRRHNQ